MLRRVMVVVLLACVGLTASVAFGTLFSSNQSRASIPSLLLPAQSSCHHDWRLHSSPQLPPNIGVHPPTCERPCSQGDRCFIDPMPVMPVPGSLRHGAPSGGLPMGDYVLFGLLGGLSAAVGFLVPPRSSLTAMR